MKNILDRVLSVLDWGVAYIIVPIIVGSPIIAIMIYIFHKNINMWINTLAFGLGMCSIWCFAKVARNWIRNK